MRISYSSLDAFKQCPQKYKFREIDRIRAPKLKEAVFGSIIHGALKYFHSQRPLFPSLSEFLDFYKREWNPEPFSSEIEEVVFFNEGERILKHYFSQNDPSKFNVIDLETLFRVPIEEHLLVGKIDRIDKLEDGSIEIIDYKTSKTMPSQVVIDDNLQLSLYCIGTLFRWPHFKNPENIKLSLYYLKHGEKLSTKRTKKQLEETKNQVLDMVAEIKKSDFKPTPSPLCDWCGYKKICPMWKHKYRNQESGIRNQEEVKNIIREFFELKEQGQKNTKRLTELREVINNYLNQEKLERIFADEGHITRLPQTRYAYNFTKVKEILEPLGKWDTILTINATKLKKVVGSLPFDVKKKIQSVREIDKEFSVLQVTRGKNKK